MPDTQGLPWPEGDPGTLRSVATALRGVGGRFGDTGSRMGTAAASTDWTGEAKDRFVSSVAGSVGILGGADQHFDAVARALDDLATELEVQQTRVLRLAESVRIARAEEAEAAAEAERASSRATVARVAADFALVDPGLRATATTAQADADAAGAAHARASIEASETWRFCLHSANGACDEVDRVDARTAGVLDTPVPPIATVDLATPGLQGFGTASVDVLSYVAASLVDPSQLGGAQQASPWDVRLGPGPGGLVPPAPGLGPVVPSPDGLAGGWWLPGDGNPGLPGLEVPGTKAPFRAPGRGPGVLVPGPGGTFVPGPGAGIDDADLARIVAILATLMGVGALLSLVPKTFPRTRAEEESCAPDLLDMKGPVCVYVPEPTNPDQVAQVSEYVVAGDQAIATPGVISPTGRVASAKALARDDPFRTVRLSAEAATRRERRKHPDLYNGPLMVAGHGPDVMWTGSGQAFRWIPMHRDVNSSLSTQQQLYPIGYVPTDFVLVPRYPLGTLP